MNCRSCDYPLWNLRERRCPECGEPFNVRDFEFAPSSVQYCCPHCMQAYYGLSPTGHLQPEEFACVKCGQVVHMETMVLLPTAGVREEQTRAMGLPWSQRRDRGRFQAWFSTIGWGFGRPVDIGRALKGEPKVRDALLFGFITISIVMLMMAVLPMLACGLFTMMPGGGGGFGAGVMAMVITIVVVMIGSFVVINVCALLTHAILWATGGCASTVGGTVEVMNYTTGPFIICAIPCLGGYIWPISWIWWTVSSVMAVMHRQEVSVWRALLAVVLPLVVAPVLVFGLWIGAMYMSVSSAMTGMGTMPPAMAQFQLDGMKDALDAYAVDHPGERLAHPLQLIVDQNLMAQDFVPGWQITADQIPVGTSTLDDFVFWVQAGGATQQEIDSAILAEIEAIPDDARAIRLGEFVFPYYGDSILPPGYGTDAVPGVLWLAMIAPAKDIDPNVNYYDDSVAVLRADGTTTVYPTQVSFRRALTEQNELRAENGFGDLRHPDEVKHAGP